MASTATYSIGGIALTLSGTGSLERLAALPCMKVFRTSSSPATAVRIALDVPLPQPEMRLLHRFDLADGAKECRFGIDADGVYHFIFGDTGLLCYNPKRPDDVSISTITDVEVLRFALWTAYAMAALRRGVVPVHASVVVCHGRAVLCLGESGTGKSTHTSLWIKHINGSWLLNDDSPLLAVEGDEVVVYGSPWSGKTPCYRCERVPVAALLRLEQRPANVIDRLGTVQAFAALQPSCPPALSHDEHTMDLIVDFISQVISRIPVHRLGCLPDADAARLSHDTIFPQP